METIKQSYVICMLIEKLGKIEGRTRLQKLSFLLDKKLNLELGYEKALYGPFSDKLSEIVDFLKNDQMIQEEVVLTNFGKRYNYLITEKGKDFLESHKSEVTNPEEVERSIAELEEFNKMDLEDLLRYIYRNNPKFAGEFKFSK